MIPRILLNDQRFEYIMFDGCKIAVRVSDGWINAKQIFESYGQSWSKSVNCNEFNKIIDSAENSMKCKLTSHITDSIVQANGIYIHFDLAVITASWISSNFADMIENWTTYKMIHENNMF